MAESILTEEGQTTIPKEVREALRIKPHQRLQWELEPDGSVRVRPERSALDVFGSLKLNREYPGAREEKEAVRRIMGEQAAREG